MCGVCVCVCVCVRAHMHACSHTLQILCGSIFLATAILGESVGDFFCNAVLQYFVAL